MYKISIIIPIYNVEAYIERCARSLYEQTYAHIEYIWVNDATPDNSIQILKRVTDEYPQRKADVRIVEHSFNKGLPTARNTGLSVSGGDYIFHCDSDDWADKDMIELFCEKATRTEADIVYSDWYLTFAKSERYMVQPALQTPLECIEAMLSGPMRFNVWNKMVRRSLYTDISFPDGYGMGEDMTMIKLFASAKKVVYLHKAFYHYMQINPHAFTKVYSKESWRQLYYNVSDIKRFIRQKYGFLFEKQLHFFCLNVKLPFLMTGNKHSYEHWLYCFPESNEYIEQNNLISIRIRWLQQAALKRQFWLIRVHYYMLFKLVYGIIYRK